MIYLFVGAGHGRCEASQGRHYPPLGWCPAKKPPPALTTGGQSDGVSKGVGGRSPKLPTPSGFCATHGRRPSVFNFWRLYLARGKRDDAQYDVVVDLIGVLEIPHSKRNVPVRPGRTSGGGRHPRKT